MSLEEGDINGGSRPTPGEWGVAIARDSAGGAHGCTAHAGDGRTPLPLPCHQQTISRQVLSQAKNI